MFYPLTKISRKSKISHLKQFFSCIQPGLVICFTLDNIHVSEGSGGEGGGRGDWDGEYMYIHG